MSIITKIKSDLLAARKAKNSELTTLLSTLSSAIENVGLNSKDGKRETTDDEALGVIKKFKEGVEDVMKFAADRGASVKHELELYKSYMPQMMSEDELKSAISKFLEEIEKSPKAIGIIQGKLASTFGSFAYDKALAAKLIKEMI